MYPDMKGDPKTIAMCIAVREGPGFTGTGQRPPGSISLVR